MPSGNLGIRNQGRDTVESSVRAFNTPETLQNFNTLINNAETTRQNLLTKRIQEDKNVKLNSLKGLFVQSGDDLNTASLKASSYFNRIDGAKDNNELNSIYGELDSIREQAASNNKLFGKTTEAIMGPVPGWIEGAVGGIAELGKKLFVDLPSQTLEATGLGHYMTNHLKEYNQKELRKSNPREDLFNHSFVGLDQEDLFSEVKNQINQKKTQQFADNYLNQFQDFTSFKQELQSAIANPSKSSAFNKLKNSFLDNEFTVKGSDFYRDGEDSETFRQRAKTTLTNPNKEDVNARYFNYDLENSALNSLKSSLNRQLEQVWNTPIKNKKGEIVRDEAKLKDIRDSMALIDKRQQENSKIYAVNDYEKTWDSVFGKGREQSLAGAFYSGIKPLGSKISEKLGFSDDFENTIEQKALYLPVQKGTDVNGNAVMSNQAFYTKQDGSLGFNGSSVLEGGLQMVGQMAPTIALTVLTEGFAGSLAAEAAAAEAGIAAGTLEASALAETSALSRGALSFTKAYDKFNKVSLAGKELRLADRAATFASVYATTYPMIEAEERKYGGNYKARAAWKTSIESSTEAVGFPDVGALRMRPMQTSLVGDAARMAGKTIKEIPISDRLAMYMNTGKEFGKLVLKQNAVEALEEEMSLIGNYMYENMASDEFKDREKTRLNADALMDTFAESFIGGLIYSGGTTAIGVRSFVNKNNLQKTADWNAANNPDLMKAKIKEMNSKGKISDEDTYKAITRIDDLHNTLKSAFGINQLKDAKARLEDKDAQYEYFQNLVARKDHALINYDSLTDEGKELLKDKIVGEKVFVNTSKKIDEIKLELAELKLKESTATEEDAKRVEELNEKLGKLQFIKTAVVKKSTLTNTQKEYLLDNGLMPEDKPYSVDDFNREIAKIDTALLKTQKRIDKYVNLTPEEKQKVLDDSYDDQIAAIKEVKNPSKIYQGFVDINNLLDEYEKKGTEFEELDKKNAERLRDAYGEKLKELTKIRNEEGYNAIEQELLNSDINSLVETNDVHALLEHQKLMEDNADFISADLKEQLSRENMIMYSTMMLDINTMDADQRVNFLTDYLDKELKNSAIPAFEVDVLNEKFGMSDLAKVEFTQDELDAARLKVLELRGVRRAASLVNKGQVVTASDLTKDAIDEGLSPEEVEEVDQFNKENSNVVETLKTADTTVDESGKSEVKDLLAQDYEAKKAKYKTFPELAKIATNLRNLVFPRSTSFDSNYYKLKTLHEALFAGGSLEDFNKQVQALIAKNPTNVSLTQYVDFVNRLLKDFPITPTQTEKKEDTVETPIQNNITPSILTGEIKQIEDELTNQDKQKQERLVSLASPLRTMGVEVSKEDVARTDEAVIRKVNQIEELKTQDDPSKSTVIINRKEFMLKFFREIKGMSEDQAIEALNAFEDFFRNNEKGTPLPEELVALVGDKFFEASMIEYFLENNSKGFSTEPDILVSTVDKNGKLVLILDYPIDLSVTSSKNKEGNIPWNVSARVIRALQGLGYTKEQAEQLILAEHQERFNQFEEIKKAVKEGSQVIAPFSVSNGVMINKPKQLSREDLKQQNITDVETKTLEDFKLITGSGDEAFGKTLQFEIGRLYLNVDGQPVLLSNKQLYPDEAAALTELLFLPVEPDEFDSPAQFRNYMFSLINQADRKNRLYFKENPDYGKVDGAPHTVVIQSITDDKGVRTYKQLSKEEVGAILPKMYYKVNKASLDGKRSIIRYFIHSEGENAGQIDSANQPYVDYLKDTHTFPVSNGALAKPVNKQIYFYPEIKPQTPPLTTTEKKTTEAPVQSKSADTTVVPPSPFKDDATTTAVAKVKTLMPDADKIVSILTYEEAVEEHKKSSKFLPVSASVFTSKEFYEAIIDEIIFRNLPIKAVGFIEDISYDLKSANNAKEATTGLSIMLVSNPENPAQTFRIYLSLDTTKGEHIMGVKAAELTNPKTVIVPKEEPKPKPEGSFDTEEWLNNTFGEENAPTVEENVATPVPTQPPTSPATQAVPVVEKKMTARERLNAMPKTTDEVLDNKTKEKAKEAKNNCVTGDLQNTINQAGSIKAKHTLTRKKK